MKTTQRLGIIMIVLFVALSAVQVYGREIFDISAFDINMVIHEDNSYLVIETISIDFSKQSHGIIRSIPLKTYRGKMASVEDVIVRGHNFSTERTSEDFRIKIGDPDKYASSSEKYIISYLYTIGDDGLEDKDELYWNLIGLGWDCTIDNVTFTINMPEPFEYDRLNFTYGERGSVKNSEVSWNVEGNTIKGSLLTSLGPNEALTVALPLPEGYFSGVEKTEKIGPGSGETDKLDLNTGEAKGQSEGIEQSGKTSKDNGETKSLFQGIIEAIKDFFVSLFSKLKQMLTPK